MWHIYCRTLTTHNHTHALSEAAINKAAISKDDVRNFMSVFPDLVRDLNSYATKYDKIYGPKWLSKLLQYTVPNGKKYRGIEVDRYYYYHKANNLYIIRTYCGRRIQNSSKGRSAD
jgi:hypothetical protein